MKNLTLSILFFFTLFSLNLYGQPYDVVWTDLIGLTANGNDLNKTTVNGWDNGGAASENILATGQDGWVEITASEKTTNRMFGLSETNLDAHYNTIKYLFYLAEPGNLYIYENGVFNNAVSGGYNTGDILRIERINNTILFKKNSSLVYTSTIPSTTSLIMDVSLYETNTTISNAQASFPVPGGGDPRQRQRRPPRKHPTATTPIPTSTPAPQKSPDNGIDEDCNGSDLVSGGTQWLGSTDNTGEIHRNGDVLVDGHFKSKKIVVQNECFCRLCF